MWASMLPLSQAPVHLTHVTKGHGGPGSGGSFIQGGINTARLPWNNRTSIRVDKNFSFKPRKEGGKGSNLNVYFYVQNLFDVENVRIVYPYTGRPDDNGYLDSDLAERNIRELEASGGDADAYRMYYGILIADFDNVTLPRQARIGFTYSF